MATPLNQFSPLSSKTCNKRCEIAPGILTLILVTNIRAYHLQELEGVGVGAIPFFVCWFLYSLIFEVIMHSKLCLQNHYFPVFDTLNDNFAYSLCIFSICSKFWGCAYIMTYTYIIHKWMVLILVSIERGHPYLYIGSKLRVIWPFILVIWNKPPSEKYVLEKCSGEPS